MSLADTTSAVSATALAVNTATALVVGAGGVSNGPGREHGDAHGFENGDSPDQQKSWALTTAAPAGPTKQAVVTAAAESVRADDGRRHVSKHRTDGLGPGRNNFLIYFYKNTIVTIRVWNHHHQLVNIPLHFFLSVSAIKACPNTRLTY